MIPTEQQLTDAIEVATRKAVVSLFREHPEKFYYLSLITSGEGHSPFLAAWSFEALDEAVRRHPDGDEVRRDLKWSFADSPYLLYGENEFERVNRLFSRRPELNSTLAADDWFAEYSLRIRAMELAMKRLDLEGLFGVGDARLEIVVNVEVMPPDHTNVERALRLNPPLALTDWLEDVAEFQ